MILEYLGGRNVIAFDIFFGRSSYSASLQSYKANTMKVAQSCLSSREICISNRHCDLGFNESSLWEGLEEGTSRKCRSSHGWTCPCPSSVIFSRGAEPELPSESLCYSLCSMSLPLRGRVRTSASAFSFAERRRFMFVNSAEVTSLHSGTARSR